jgi:hypothetical protein
MEANALPGESTILLAPGIYILDLVGVGDPHNDVVEV